MKKISVITAIILVLLMAATGCSSGAKTSASAGASAGASSSASAGASSSASAGITVKVSGLDDAVTLLQGIGQNYMSKNTNVTVDVASAASNVAIAKCADKTADIAVSWRDLKDIEKTTFTGMTGKVLCADAICVVAGKGSSITDLSADKIKSIFTGAITNWKDAGGKDEKIKVYTMESSSDIRSAFNSMFLGKDADGKQIKTDDSITTPESATKDMVTALEGDPTGIGYLPLSVLTSTLASETKASAGASASPSASASASPSASASATAALVTLKALNVDSVTPTAENIASGSYKYYIPFIMMTRNPKTDASAFYDYCFGSDGINYIKSQGYAVLK